MKHRLNAAAAASVTPMPYTIAITQQIPVVYCKASMPPLNSWTVWPSAQKFCARWTLSNFAHALASFRWINQLRQDHQRPPADLWRAAIRRGHTGATLRSSTTTRWRRRRQQPGLMRFDSDVMARRSDSMQLKFDQYVAPPPISRTFCPTYWMAERKTSYHIFAARCDVVIV